MQKDKLVNLYVQKQKKLDQLTKEVVLNNLYAFNKMILEIEEGKDEAGKPRAKLGQFHKDLCKFIQHGKTKKKLVLMPRGHLKTSLVTIGYTLQRIAKNPNIRVLLSNATGAMAQAFLGQIKRHLKYNETFIDMFGDLSDGAEKWRDDMITFKKGKDSYKTKEANVIAYGAGGNLVSQHYDLIIHDDLHNRENISTKDQIDKVKLAYVDTLDLLEPGGELIVLGTRWHYDDLYGWLMDKENPGSRGFSVFFQKAIKNAKIVKDPTGGYIVEDGEILWPEKYNKKHLNQLLNDKGLYEWNCQYQNNPIDDENAVFQRSWFKEYEPTELKGRRMVRITAIDPAISLKERADYTAIVTVGVDQFENIYILEVKRGRYSEKRLADELFNTAARHKPALIVLETVAFQKVLQHFIESEMKKRNLSLPIEEVVPESGESKEKRIRSLQPYYMRGNIYHSQHVANIDYVEDELLRFPKGKNDDTIDALAYAVQKSFPPRKRKKQNVKYKWLY
jgi:predicted phage terminase large subunit-like protein